MREAVTCWVPAARPAPHRPSTWRGRRGWHVACWCQAKGPVCPEQLQHDASQHPLHWPPCHGRARGGWFTVNCRLLPKPPARKLAERRGRGPRGIQGAIGRWQRGGDVRGVSKGQGLLGLSPVSPNTPLAEGWGWSQESCPHRWNWQPSSRLVCGPSKLVVNKCPSFTLDRSASPLSRSLSRLLLASLHVWTCRYLAATFLISQKSPLYPPKVCHLLGRVK